jgi:adenine-specific DNA-methyltransferase
MPKRISRSQRETKDYRHTEEKRKNIPPAKIAAEGEVPKIKKARYYYSPHLSPELRFDPTSKADRMMMVKDKVGQYLTKEDRQFLDHALSNQQPWLEWAEKKEQYDRGWFEVDPVALHIHERISTQAIIRSAMRKDIQRSLFADPQLPYQKEVQFYCHDIDWANRLVLGDSLQVMSSLSRRENLAGKVQMIYMDPPYGIKFRSNFQIDVGSRAVGERDEDLTREPEMVKAYRDTWNLGVHSYLQYLIQRLIPAKEILSSSGSIFVQIGDENVHRVRLILDAVFGPQNFVSQIAFTKGGSGLETEYRPAARLDYILWYAKDFDQLRFNKIYAQQLDPREVGYHWLEFPSGFSRRLSENEWAKGWKPPSGAFLFQDESLTKPGPGAKYEIEYAGRLFNSGKRWWGTPKDALMRAIKANRVFIVGNTLRRKKYSHESAPKALNNLWDGLGGPPDPVFVVQTNREVIERCILMTTFPGDLVLDPTCGSGTTAEAAEKWGRRWITIDTSRVAVAIARQRMLSAKFEYYSLHCPEKGPSGGFILRNVPNVTMSSVSQNHNLDPIFDKHEPILDQALDRCNKALELVSDSINTKLRLKLVEKQNREGKRAITEADLRRWDLPRKGNRWKHWEVPFDTDPEWPKSLHDAVTAYRKAWRMKIDEVNSCIAANAEQEEIVDQPEVVRNVLRVSGPFTVEGVRPEELSLGEEGSIDITSSENGESDIIDVGDEAQNLRAYLFRMVELIRKDGVTFPNNRFCRFARVDSLFKERTGTPLHAEGLWEGVDLHEPNNIAIAFGPQYGPVTAQQVEDIIRASKRYDELVIAGFSFDGEAAVAIQEAGHPKLKIHMAHIRPDAGPGMDGLLKDTPKSQLFTVFGQPEIKVLRHGKDEVKIELLGVDIFDPLKGEVHSTGAEKVAAWFLDSDYDGRCFCITQAFFPDQDAWEKIAKALGFQADEESFAAFKGTISLPFKPGKHNRIAVKVTDPRGNEVMTFRKLRE